jgi:diguanylate cyclase (GGDEF)-like protein
MTFGHFPLLYRENLLGFLWLWGEDLREDDLPTLSVFANQVAATLENARLFADVQRLAVTDGLTQLYTRRHFFTLAYEEFSRAHRYSRAISVIMFDIDHFKKVNDNYGHSTGDFVLEKVAASCRETLRTHDIVGRYGGEEIIVLLVETDLKAAEQVALRIGKNIRDLSIPTSSSDVRITVSGGVSGDDAEEVSLPDMIEAADQALYRAKKAGRDRIEVAPRYVRKESD